MPKTYTISEEQAKEIAEIRKTVKDKKIDKRLHAIQLRGEGMKNPEIADKLDTASRVVSRWVSAFCNNGIDDLMGGKHGGNRRNLSYVEEEKLLSRFTARMEKGEIVTSKEIKIAYEEAVGHRIGKGQIYRVLARHEFRKVMPRSKHPNKASEEEIDSSKKLKQP